MNQKIKTILLWIVLITFSWIFVETIKEMIFSSIFLYSVYDYGALSILDNFLTEDFFSEIFSLIFLLAISILAIKKSHKWLCFINPSEMNKINKEDIKKIIIYYSKKFIISFIIILVILTISYLLIGVYEDNFLNEFISTLVTSAVLAGLSLFFIKWWNEIRIRKNN